MTTVGLFGRIAGVVLLLALVALFGTGALLWQMRAGPRSDWHEIVVGTSEEEVRAKLGKPFRDYERATAPDDYYEPGYAKETRQISSRVLLYTGADLIFYVWIGENGRVEHTFIGGS